MLSPQNDEEYGPYGEECISLLDCLFPNEYKALIIINPSFNRMGRPNIAPQVSRGDFFVLSSVEDPKGTGRFRGDLSRFSPAPDVDEMLDHYRFEHAIFASSDLSILTAWAQAEYAVVAFRGNLLDEYSEWLEEMQDMEVVRRIP